MPTYQDEETLAAKKKIKQAQYRTAMAGDKARLLQSDSINQFGGDNEARIAAIRASQAANSAAQGATMAPPPALRGDEIEEKTVRDRVGLYSQGLRVADARLKSAATAPTPQAQAEGVAEGSRIQQAATESFGSPLTPEQMQERVEGYRRSQAIAAANQRANQGMEEEGRGRYEAGLAATQEAGDIRRNIGMTGLRLAESEGNRELATSKARSTPDGIASGIAAEQTRQKIDAMRAKGELAQVGAETSGMERGAALSGFGIDDKFQARVTNNIGALNDAMSDLVTGRVAGNSFGGAEGVIKTVNALDADIANLERAAAQDTTPATKELADTLLNMLPLPGENGAYDSAMFGGNPILSTVGTMGVGAATSAANSGSRSVSAKRMTDIRRRLERIARPQPAQ